MIEFRTAKTFEESQLKELFASVGWLSAQYSERLVKALQNSDTVISAWDNNNLIGLINALDDGELTAYVHYLLVNPNYQNQGVGTELLKQLKEKYREYLYLVLNAENKVLVEFYEKMDFKVMQGATPMVIKTL